MGILGKLAKNILSKNILSVEKQKEKSRRDFSGVKDARRKK